ncbi:MAG: Chromosome partition protein Smc [Mycoplasmataceae bacterium]|nr:MAG: Chromosome partition protein Smc [Mycoplasmataceae bacterium]
MKEQAQIQAILNRFKQPFPSNLIQLTLEEGNYCGPTNPKWNKPLCERYGFIHQEKWIQIDIPHSLLDKLELEKAKAIIYPLYLNPQALNKEPNYGGITIEDEEEIFIDKPVSEKNVEKEIIKRLEELEILRDKTEGLEEEKENLENKFEVSENKRRELEEELNNLNSNYHSKEQKNKDSSNQIDTLSQKITKLEGELAKEKSWWEKWMADDNFKHRTPIVIKEETNSNKNEPNPALFVHQATNQCFAFQISTSDFMLDYNTTNQVSLTDAKRMVKAIAEWYKNQDE